MQIPAVTFSEGSDIASIVVPSQTAGTPVPSSEVTAEGEAFVSPWSGAWNGVRDAVSAVQTTLGGGSSSGVAVPELRLAYNITGMNLTIPTQEISGFRIPSQTFYLASSNSSGGASISTVTVSRQTIPYVINVTAVEGEEPNRPNVVTSGGACVAGSPFTISMTSSDPDGEDVRYGVDWNRDGSVDQFVPESGYVSSGTTRTATRTYSSGGQKNVGVFAQDESGMISEWSTFTFQCAGEIDPNSETVGLDEFDDPNFGDGFGGGSAVITPSLSIRAIPSLLRTGKTSVINWSATGVESCTVRAPNGDNWSGLSSPVGGEVSSPITGEMPYTLSCTTESGEVVTKRAVVRIIPSFLEQ